MRAFDKLPEGAKVMTAAPPLSVIIGSNQFPAYLRLAAAEIDSKAYSTVGSVLTSMCRDDILSVLENWTVMIEMTRQQIENQMGDEMAGKDTITVGMGGAGFVSYVIFCSIIAHAEMGESKFDSATLGFQAELMASFLKASLVASSFDDVVLDLPSLSLSPDFMDKNFDAILQTTNFKAMKYVKEVTALWRQIKKSESYSALQAKPGSKKDDEVADRRRGYNSESLLKALGKLPEADQPSKPVEAQPSETKSSAAQLSDLEAKLRKRLGG